MKKYWINSFYFKTLSSGYNEVAFENRETNALLELHHMGGIESSEG